MSHRKISAALSTRLTTLPTLPSVAWENAPFEPVDGVLYLREFYKPAETPAVGVEDSSADNFNGFYQISIYAPSDNYKLAAQTMAEEIAAHFARGTALVYQEQCVRIRSTSITGGINEDARFIIPVTINWRSFS